MSVRETFQGLGDQGWTESTKLDLLIEFLDSHGAGNARAECERYLEAAAAGREYRRAGERERQALRGAMVRASGIVAAQRVRLDGLGVEDVRNLAAVVRDLEGKATSERQKRRRGDFWS